jgi:hypothetical protein
MARGCGLAGGCRDLGQRCTVGLAEGLDETLDGGRGEAGMAGCEALCVLGVNHRVRL